MYLRKAEEKQVKLQQNAAKKWCAASSIRWWETGGGMLLGPSRSSEWSRIGELGMPWSPFSALNLNCGKLVRGYLAMSRLWRGKW